MTTLQEGQGVVDHSAILNLLPGAGMLEESIRIVYSVLSIFLSNSYHVFHGDTGILHKVLTSMSPHFNEQRNLFVAFN